MSPLVSRTAGVEESLADASKRANAAVVLLVVLGGDGVKGVCLELEELKGGGRPKPRVREGGAGERQSIEEGVRGVSRCLHG